MPLVVPHVLLVQPLPTLPLSHVPTVVTKSYPLVMLDSMVLLVVLLVVLVPVKPAVLVIPPLLVVHLAVLRHPP